MSFTFFPRQSSGSSRLVVPGSQHLATYLDISEVRNKIFFDYNPIYQLPIGETEIDLDGIISPITVRGDVRPLAGHTWWHGLPITSAKAGAGAGTTTLSNTANPKQIQISCSTAAIDLTGWVAGSKAIICSKTGSVGLFTINGFTGDTVTFDLDGDDVPEVDGLGAFITLVPNVSITNSVNILSTYPNIGFQGIYFQSTSSLNVLGKSTLENCCFFGCAEPVKVSKSGLLIFIEKENSIIQSQNGIHSILNGFVSADYVSIAKSSNVCFLAEDGGKISAKNSVSSWGSEGGYFATLDGFIACEDSLAIKMTKTGYHADNGAKIKASGAGAQYCTTTGFKATRVSVIEASDCSTNTDNNGSNTSKDTTSELYYD